MQQPPAGNALPSAPQRHAPPHSTGPPSCPPFSRCPTVWVGWCGPAAVPRPAPAPSPTPAAAPAAAAAAIGVRGRGAGDALAPPSLLYGLQQGRRRRRGRAVAAAAAVAAPHTALPTIWRAPFRQGNQRPSIIAVAPASGTTPRRRDGAAPPLAHLPPILLAGWWLVFGHGWPVLVAGRAVALKGRLPIALRY